MTLCNVQLSNVLADVLHHLLALLGLGFDFPDLAEQLGDGVLRLSQLLAGIEAHGALLAHALDVQLKIKHTWST